MKIDIQKLREGPLAYDVCLTPEYLADEPEHDVRFEPAQGRVIFTLQGQNVFAEGRLATTAHLACARCLVETSVTIDVPVHLYYWPENARREESTVDIDVDEPDYGLYKGDTLDPDEDLRELLLVELPVVPLCREDCNGLCPHCGKNLNEGPCGCEKESEPDVAETEPDWKRRLRDLKLPPGE
ncbi:DUF177 domain-containing protein [Candidatus Sumerlaeota bacterium]|nr:DUF177 domain-containing protein [Candidatus Sumerlaeota bacterium]